ncbi:hypothetical protein EJB05_19614 [Eragrostis curvula]|uniref:Uncharacterized protein n=1 Tax=Eragrostis curvula TaxID=38414 RepID=A0A5J9UWW8_9POAL|nr:hypothetical protein EJB05_19614 [Eragrostis curvula]
MHLDCLISHYDYDADDLKYFRTVSLHGVWVIEHDIHVHRGSFANVFRLMRQGEKIFFSTCICCRRWFFPASVHNVFFIDLGGGL